MCGYLVHYVCGPFAGSAGSKQPPQKREDPLQHVRLEALSARMAERWNKIFIHHAINCLPFVLLSLPFERSEFA